MDEAKEKGDSVSIVKESSVTFSETVFDTMVSEDQIRVEEGGEAGRANGDDVMVEVSDSRDESGEVGLEGNPRTFVSECDASGGSGGEPKAQIEVNGDVIRACSNDEAVCSRDQSGEVGLEGNPRTLDNEGDAAGNLGSRNESGEAKAQNYVNGTVFEGSGTPGSSAVNAQQSSGIDKGGGDLNQATETRKVGDLDGNGLNHGNEKTVACSSVASEDPSVRSKDVEEAAMMIDEEDLNTLDGAHETISEPIKKVADVDVDATQVTTEGVPDSEAQDPVYICQSTELVVEGHEKVKEFDKQGTDSKRQQMEVKTPHRSTENHDSGDQNLKPETVIDGGQEVDSNTAEAMHVEKQVSEAQNLDFDAEVDVKVESMGVAIENRNAGDVFEPLDRQTDVFIGSGEGEASKVDNNVSNQISDAVASDKVLLSSGNEDQLSKNADSEDDSSVGQGMNVEEQVTDDEPDSLEQGEEMEVEEHDTDSEEPTNIDEHTVKQTDLKSASAVKAHQAKYQLPSKEEGGFSVSDLVLGKVRSHPWWPGQIFDPSDASEKAVKYHKKDSFLVAYFGDRTFAWNEASVLKPFRMNFSRIEKQSNSELFQNAVDCALEEVHRRVELGLACSCIPQDVYDKIKFQKVENTGVREESSLREGVNISLSASFFEPDKLVDYMKALAESPSGGGDRLDLVIAKAQLLAFYRLKGYQKLPEFQLSEEKTLEVVQCATPMDTDGEQIPETSKTRRSSYLKRKHNLKDVLYPSKKDRSLSELMSETFDSPESEISSDGIANKTLSSSFGRKRKAVGSSEDSSLPKESPTTPHFPKPSFKIGERIRRAASQMTRSPSMIKSSADRLQKVDGGYDFPDDNFEDTESKRMDISTEYSSLDELLSQLHLAACDPMKSYNFLNITISFFSDFRDSMVLDRLSGDKAGGKRKKSPNSIIGSSRTFEFEDRSDTYWTDRIVQNGPEEHRSLGTGSGQYQIVPVELEKPIQKGRKSRKRYSDLNHDLTAQKPPGYVDEKAPAEIVMNFSDINSVPSETKLNKMFKHFGPLKESETEVDRETSRARVVFRRSSDAEVAYNSAGKFNIFGQVVVTYQLNYTISESFKASLYAPTLAEENPFIASSPCGDHALVASTLGEETSLIAPSLGEEASFMVSTCGEETLPVATSFHEEPSFISSIVGEDTLAIPTTLADGTSVVVTTMYEETLPVTTTAGAETMDPEIPSAETMYEETLPVTTTSTITTTSGEQTSRIATMGPEIPSVPATVGEKTRSIPTTLGEETHSIPANMDEVTPIHPVTLVEETPDIPRILGEDTPSIPAAFNDETPAVPPTFSEGSAIIPETMGRETQTISTTVSEETTIPATLGQETLIVSATWGEKTPSSPVTLGEETLIVLPTLGEETPSIPTTLGEETHSIPSTSDEETRIFPTNLGKKTPTNPVTLAEETPSFLITLGEDSPFVPAAFNEETLAVPSTFSQGTRTIPETLEQETRTIPTTVCEETTIPATLAPDTFIVSAALGEETTSIPAISGEETHSIPSTSGKGNLSIPTNLDKETPTDPVTLAEETPSIPRTLGEDTPSIPAAFNEETSAVPSTFSQGTPTIPETLCEETTSPATLGHETPIIPATSGEETPTIPPTLGEETHSIPSTLGEETRSISTNLDEETPTDPMSSAEEIPSIPGTLGEETPSIPAAFSEDTPVISPTFREETPTVHLSFSEATPTVPVTLSPETQTIPTTMGKKTTTSGEEAITAPTTLHEETHAIPTTLAVDTPTITAKQDEETPTNPKTLDEEIPTSPINLAKKTSISPTTSGVEASAVLTTNSKETSAVPTEMETFPPAVAESVEPAT